MTKARQKHQLMTTRQTPVTERSKSKTAEPKEKRKCSKKEKKIYVTGNGYHYCLKININNR